MHSRQIEVNSDGLAQTIADAGKPIHINLLARTAVTIWLQQHAQTRLYAPGATYQLGETIRWNGRSATITAIQSGHNPKQGIFQILTLRLPDGSENKMAAGIASAPAVDEQEVTVAEVEAVLQQDGLRWRTAVQETLTPLPEFVHFQNEQGDYWCLTDLLPDITEAELQHVWAILQEQAAAPFQAVPTGSLVTGVWGQPNDGSADYLLFAFALNVALQAYREVQYVAGAGWMLSDQWRNLAQRPSLIGPRMSNTVPEATDDDEAETAVPTSQPQPIADTPLDVEAWRQQRRDQASLVLKASHYYYHWLPLTREMQRLFPHWPSQVTIYHRFSGQESSFTAVIHPEQKRLLTDRAIYEALRESGIYPGARLVFSHRGSDYAYDVRTQLASSEQTATVRRLALDPNTGELEYWEDEEPLRYEVDGDVFVADARWEDLPALFQQAEAAGQGIFGLMFEQCNAWAHERGTLLIVTTDELFTTIYYGPRLTSRAMIAFDKKKGHLCEQNVVAAAI